MTTTIHHGPEVHRYLSHEHWHDTEHLFRRCHDALPSLTVAVDARGRICTAGRHYCRARDEGAYPVVVYRVDGEE